MAEKSLSKRIKKTQNTLAVAESCTGGLISKKLTDIPGASQFFKLGIVAYSNKIKKSLLKIPESLLNNKGAVSKEVAVLLAKNVKKIAKTDIGLGVTGIAGPSGGTAQKPVGLVFIACAYKKKIIAKKFIFKKTRKQIREKSAGKALEIILSTIK